MRIIETLQLEEKGFEMQNIKTDAITAEQLDEMYKLAGTYESLFSRKSMKYRPMGLHEKTLTENEYKDLILQEYSFLKRPVIVADNTIYIGNAKATVEAAAQNI